MAEIHHEMSELLDKQVNAQKDIYIAIYIYIYIERERERERESYAGWFLDVKEIVIGIHT